MQKLDIPNETTDVIWIDEKENGSPAISIYTGGSISIKEVEVVTVKVMKQNHEEREHLKPGPKRKLSRYHEYTVTMIRLPASSTRKNGGNTSDRYITEHSGFLDLVSAGDEIMADRGFRIRDLLLERRAYLTMPPFTRKCSWGKGKRLTAYEIRKTRKIANVRIYVEQAIQRMKKFKMLSQILLWTQKPLVYPMMIVAGFICNLMKPLANK
ncbi:unnamed protein product [Mytilus edulis]|uniref:DDE Tnp4 domain-containing protein n=1 Tax=Mytilus edulis TaxID=6550 RepID=A0A8S3TE08_MYTED|nr:unnamed protein product [Mytilus edulis]